MKARAVVGSHDAGDAVMMNLSSGSWQAGSITKALLQFSLPLCANNLLINESVLSQGIETRDYDGKWPREAPLISSSPTDIINDGSRAVAKLRMLKSFNRLSAHNAIM